MNYILYDLAILLILAFFLWRGYARGLVLTLCGFLAIFVALIGASVLSSVLAEPVAKAIEPIIVDSIHDTVVSYYQKAPEAGSHDQSDWLEQLPIDELLDPLRESRFFKGYVETFQKELDEKAAEIVSSAARTIAHFAAVQVARTILFGIFFIVLLILWSILSHALDLVAKLPVLNSVNRWTGAAAGLAKGALVLFIAAWLLRDSFIPPETVEQSVLLKFFCTFNPLSLFQ